MQTMYVVHVTVRPVMCKDQ